MGELVTTKQKGLTIRDMFEARKHEIAKAIPRGLDPQRFLRVALTTIQNNQKLLDCTPSSLMACVMQASQWGLELDQVLGQAYLVPYAGKATLIIGYRGLLEMARRHVSIQSITARLVYEKDSLNVEYGLEPVLEHRPYLNPDRGEVVGAYCVWRLKDVGDPEFVYMPRHELDAIRERSRASESGPWVTDFDMMCLKSVIRRASRFWPQSTDLGRAVAIDERQELGLDMGHVEYDIEPTPEPKKLADALPPIPTPAVTSSSNTSTAEDRAIDAEIAAKETKPDFVPHPVTPTIDPAAREDIRKEHDARHEPRKAR